MPDDVSSSPPSPLAGLTEPRARPLERFLVRTREDSVTRSGWRLEVTCAEGSGAIVRLDAGSERPHWRGEGVFLGWPSERLASAYEALAPRDESPDLELQQLG